MKIFHLSDLHFGKQLQGYDLQKEQGFFIEFLAKQIKEEKPDGILVCGDIYDKSVPSAGAMTLFEEFLIAIGNSASAIDKEIPILVIAGNHDSAERLRFGSKFMESHHIVIATMPPQNPQEKIRKVALLDGYGEVNFYMLPFVKPGMVRHFMPEEASRGEEAIIKKLLENENIDITKRNVLLSHQFYLHGTKQPSLSDSEIMPVTVGGLDSVDISVVQKFDYVALGHIHRPQNIGMETIRYCGTPYKYSVSEADQEKSITVVELKEKGEVLVDTIPIPLLRDVRKVKGELQQVIAQCQGELQEDFVKIILTDEELLEKPKEQLEAYFDHILEITVENQRTKHVLSEEIEDLKEMTPMEAFHSFFKEQTGRELLEEEEMLLQEILCEIEEEIE